MFTGLIEAVGEIAESTAVPSGRRLRIRTPLAADLAPGDSLAVNGVCLTVASRDGDAVAAEAGPETLRVTTLGALSQGSLVNLERPLRPDGRLGGHFVQGHVDAVGVVEEFRPADTFHWLTIAYPGELASLIVLKGSIAVDGISLTVATLAADRFSVQLVPFTLEHTNLQRVGEGDRVNLECDIIGKYVARAAALHQVPAGS